MRERIQTEFMGLAGRMRLMAGAILVLALAGAAEAQSHVGFPTVPPPPSIGLPLPSIGLPLPSIGLPPPVNAQPPHGFAHRPVHHLSATIIYFVPYFVPAYGWGIPVAGPTARQEPVRSSEQRPLAGTLRFDVQPAGLLQLYVDGYFVGTNDQFNGEIDLEAGPHRIEIRAPGHETLAFDVRIAAGRSITYRGALKPADVSPAANPTVGGSPDASPTSPTTFYLIPGCYMGNVPPADAKLPESCDKNHVTTFKISH